MATVRVDRPSRVVTSLHRRWRWPLPATWLPDTPLRWVRAQLALELAGARGLRAVAVFALVCAAPHLLVRPWQSNAWGRWWHEITDALTGATLLAAAVSWTVLWVGLAIGYGPVWFLLPVVVAVPSLTFGVGRFVYPHTPRGRVRGRFDPDGFADWAELHRAVSAAAVRRHAAATRPAIARAAQDRRTQRGRR